MKIRSSALFATHPASVVTDRIAKIHLWIKVLIFMTIVRTVYLYNLIFEICIIEYIYIELTTAFLDSDDYMSIHTSHLCHFKWVLGCNSWMNVGKIPVLVIVGAVGLPCVLELI